MKWAWGLFISLLLLRLWLAATLQLSADEAYYWSWAQRLDLGYFDHPPMIAWWTGLGTGLLGDTELGVRILPGLSFVVTAIAWACLHCL